MQSPYATAGTPHHLGLFTYEATSGVKRHSSLCAVQDHLVAALLLGVGNQVSNEPVEEGDKGAEAA